MWLWLVFMLLILLWFVTFSFSFRFSFSCEYCKMLVVWSLLATWSRFAVYVDCAVLDRGVEIYYLSFACEIGRYTKRTSYIDFEYMPFRSRLCIIYTKLFSKEIQATTSNEKPKFHTRNTLTSTSAPEIGLIREILQPFTFQHNINASYLLCSSFPIYAYRN